MYFSKWHPRQLRKLPTRCWDIICHFSGAIFIICYNKNNFFLLVFITARICFKFLNFSFVMSIVHRVRFLFTKFIINCIFFQSSARKLLSSKRKSERKETIFMASYYADPQYNYTYFWFCGKLSVKSFKNMDSPKYSSVPCDTLLWCQFID